MRISQKNASVQFASVPKMGLDLISPKNLFVIAGRGTGKTADILAERSIKVIKDMPGAYLAWVAATYEDAHRNIIPTLFEGWARKGWMEGRDYVVDVKPPSTWKKPYKRPLTYKHTISFPNGAIMIVGSLDQPSSLAGNSYQHIFGDEAKYLSFEKLKKLFPAIRGEYARFSSSIYYRGLSFTTDMPDVMDKEYDWILEWKKEMDLPQAVLALRMGLEINKERLAIKKAVERGNTALVNRLYKNMPKLNIAYHRARKGLTYFHTVSSYANARVLTEDYYKDSLKALGIEEYKKSVMSLKAVLNKGESFYPTLGEHHFYSDSYKDGAFKGVGLKEVIKANWRHLKYLDPSMPLECGMDFGNQNSMVVGQRRGNYYYVLKEFWSLDPDNLEDLCKDFLEFFKGYPEQKLIAYYDRSGNQNQAVGRDNAKWLQDSIQKSTNGITGWSCMLMSRGQRTIGQSAEHLFMKKLYGGYNTKLPNILIDRVLCPNFKSSLESTKTDLRKDKYGKLEIKKDKSGEKFKGMRLVKFSSNFSDAGKYLFMRKSWVKLMNNEEFILSDPQVITAYD